MANLIEVRLTVIGPPRLVSRLDRWPWSQQLRAKYVEVWEHSGTRRVWLYQTLSLSPHHLLRSVSSHWRGLVFLLDYEDSHGGRKGLAKAAKGKVDHCEFTL